MQSTVGSAWSDGLARPSLRWAGEVPLFWQRRVAFLAKARRIFGKGASHARQ